MKLFVRVSLENLRPESLGFLTDEPIKVCDYGEMFIVVSKYDD